MEIIFISKLIVYSCLYFEILSAFLAQSLASQLLQVSGVHEHRFNAKPCRSRLAGDERAALYWHIYQWRFLSH
jgi:hypothetical protein